MKKKKLNNKKVILFSILCIFIVIFVLSSIKIIKYFKYTKENEQIKESISEYIKEIEPQSVEEKTTYEIDFKKLKSENSDTVGYLKVNNTNIDYVVVQAKDNSYYLKHNFKRKYNTSGWIFADYHNKFDGTDKNIILYGHSMKDKSMFGTLKYALTKEWFNNRTNRIITFATEDKVYNYKVFSVYKIKVEDYYIKTTFEGDSDFYSFVSELKNRSLYDFKEEVNGNDSILTLSSCIGNSNNRIVLHAKKLN